MRGVLLALFIIFMLDVCRRYHYCTGEHPRKQDDVDAGADFIGLCMSVACAIWVGTKLFGG